MLENLTIKQLFFLRLNKNRMIHSYKRKLVEEKENKLKTILVAFRGDCWLHWQIIFFIFARVHYVLNYFE